MRGVLPARNCFTASPTKGFVVSMYTAMPAFVKRVKGGTPMPVFAVKPSDLDGNGHLTSPLYFAIASDVLPADFAWNRVRAEFKKQAKPGETVHPVLYLSDGAAVVDLRDDEGVSFAVTEFTSADLGSPSR